MIAFPSLCLVSLVANWQSEWRTGSLSVASLPSSLHTGSLIGVDNGVGMYGEKIVSTSIFYIVSNRSPHNFWVGYAVHEIQNELDRTRPRHTVPSLQAGLQVETGYSCPHLWIQLPMDKVSKFI